MRGKFISIDGLDGAGLTTQATILRNWLINNGDDTILTKEPTDGLIGGLIKSSLRKEWKTSSLALQMLFAADRAHHLATEIEPALKRFKNVVSDRYILSTIAYGSIDIPQAILRQLNANFRKPHVTFILDTQPAVCIHRMERSRHHVELFEDEEKLQAIRKIYLSLKKVFPNTYVIDGNRSVEDIFKDIQKIVSKL